MTAQKIDRPSGRSFFAYIAKTLKFALYSIFIDSNVFILLLDKNAIQANSGRFKAITAV